MQFLNYIFMCLYIGIYLFFHFSGQELPAFMRTANTVICWGFLIWGGYVAGKVILDCILTGAKGQMQPVHVRNGILLAALNYLPILLMSVFMLREGFK